MTFGMHMNQSFGAGQSNVMGQGFNTLRQFGTHPQEVQSHIQQDLYPGYSYASSPMHAGATNPQIVQQHIAQDLGYAQPSYGYAGPQVPTGSTLSQFGSNPQMVRQHIQQDLHGYGYAATNQAQNVGVTHQVMQSVPAQIHSQTFGYGYAQHPASHSTLGQFGSNPQMVQQHIQQDLHNQVGAMSSQQAGAFHGANYPSAQGAVGTFGQFGTNPQVVRQHIAQDLGYYQ
ncbi:hypothetical protein URH17368_2122 [Alicyclobacillus hesperidum URH17-3-68]|nr:hypothetical protein URH17368_2122 [Alicyclobacillus hesperidum URH17-3-68]GLG01616.1 hypothetical protein Alches_16560 [Alicyclobacillus hesperidum subsp. aegles]